MGARLNPPIPIHHRPNNRRPLGRQFRRNWRVNVLFIFVAMACSQPEEIQSPWRKINFEQNYVMFEGRWRSIAQTSSKKLTKLNTVSAECYRETKTCQEHIARLYGKGEWAPYSGGYLSVTTLEFRVIEWSKARIVARHEAPGADCEIRVSLSDRSVERSFHETKARGSDTAETKIAGQWVLE